MSSTALYSHTAYTISALSLWVISFSNINRKRNLADVPTDCTFISITILTVSYRNAVYYSCWFDIFDSAQYSLVINLYLFLYCYFYVHGQFCSNEMFHFHHARVKDVKWQPKIFICFSANEAIALYKSGALKIEMSTSLQSQITIL